MKETLNPIKLFPDGDQWCALLGENLQEGVCGFGSTPIEALQAFLRVVDGDRLHQMIWVTEAPQ
jgi:hypothetical protein